MLLAVFALVSREPFPTGQPAVLALSGGIAGALGLAALYQGLAVGNAAVVAPTSGVLGVAVPVFYGVWRHGAPAPIRLAGFGLALAGIFLVSRSTGEEGERGRAGFMLGVAAGLSFGVFFILIAEAGRDLVFTTLILARVVEFALAVLVVLLTRQRIPAPRANPVALLAGLLDSAGNAALRRRRSVRASRGGGRDRVFLPRRDRRPRRPDPEGEGVAWPGGRDGAVLRRDRAHFGPSRLTGGSKTCGCGTIGRR